MVRRVTTLDGLVQTSATLNGLAIPGRSLETALARHAFNLFVNHADGTYKVLLRGSGTAIEYKGRRLLLCTQHQLDGIDRQNVGMLADDGSILVTSGGMRHYHPSTETDALIWWRSISPRRPLTIRYSKNGSSRYIAYHRTFRSTMS